MLIGYARISTEDQNLFLQQDALRAAGCERVFEDKISGAKAERPGLERVLELLRCVTSPQLRLLRNQPSSVPS